MSTQNTSDRQELLADAELHWALTASVCSTSVLSVNDPFKERAVAVSTASAFWKLIMATAVPEVPIVRT